MTLSVSVCLLIGERRGGERERERLAGKEQGQKAEPSHQSNKWHSFQLLSVCLLKSELCWLAGDPGEQKFRSYLLRKNLRENKGKLKQTNHLITWDTHDFARKYCTERYYYESSSTYIFHRGGLHAYAHWENFLCPSWHETFKVTR